MEALHDVVKAGKARYIGANSMAAWQFARLQHVADLHGWTRFVSMQNYVNLLYREEEREMLPLCVADGRGHSSEPARPGCARPEAGTLRRIGRKPINNPILFFHPGSGDRAVVDRLEEVRLGTPGPWLRDRTGLADRQAWHRGPDHRRIEGAAPPRRRGRFRSGLELGRNRASRRAICSTQTCRLCLTGSCSRDAVSDGPGRPVIRLSRGWFPIRSTPCPAGRE